MATDKQVTYFNRELSWVEFNRRVLGEGLHKKNPLLERLKFMAIVSSNFDEFFMVRVARLVRDKIAGNRTMCPSGQAPSKILSKLLKEVHGIVEQQYEALTNEIVPKLAKAGLHIARPDRLSSSQTAYMEQLFHKEIFPILTPQAIRDDQDLLPLISNLDLHILFRLEPKQGESDNNEELAIVRIPKNLDRFHTLGSSGEKQTIILLCKLITHCAEHLFPGFRILDQCVFRVTRDADMSVDEARDEDFVEAMTEVLVSRQESFPVRLEVESSKSKLINILRKKLNLPQSQVFKTKGPLDLKAFMTLCFLPGMDEYKIPDWPPQQPQDLTPNTSIWDELKQKDILLHHPYESFAPVVKLVEEAAADRNVLSIKMTLYRTSGNSPIVHALAQAARSGKHVAVLVELKARFDEGQNIEWARQLERAGVIVIYGVAQLKVHAKALLIVRREKSGIVRYAHLGTGNYNDSTAKLYVDMGLMTTKEDITYETVLFFNAITGYSAVPTLSKLIMAPQTMRSRIIRLIDREIERAEQGLAARILGKMNSLVDPGIIEGLYRASQAGVKIDLNIRGVCCLRPGVPGLSETIRVVSVIDRFLEHTRALYFHNAGNPELFMSSADWMTRNISRRIELMFPIEDPGLKKRLTNVLEYFFTDNTNAHILNEDGTYSAVTGKKNDDKRRSQEHFYTLACRKAKNLEQESRRTFDVRRKPPKKK